MHCPRCAVPLTHEEMTDAGVRAEAWTCLRCHGHYLPAGQLEVVEEVLKVSVFDAGGGIPSVRSQLSPLTCPRCGGSEPMSKLPSPRDKRVVLDICTRCQGTWLDRGELEALQSAGLLSLLGSIGRWLRGT